MKPTIGRIVHYRLSADNALRVTHDRVLKGVGRGNNVNEGDVLPLIVTVTWPDEYAGGAHLAIHPEGTAYESAFGVNGQVLLDGNDSLWVTSAPQHATLPGCWFWPPREP